MSRVVLQPAGSGAASVHYVDTIEHPVPLSKVIRHLPKDQAPFVSELYFGRAVPVWGVTAGKGRVNIRKWQSLSSGDIALFSGNGRIFNAGEITYTFRSRELALDLWKTNEDGETWEYIYLLDCMREVDIPYATFNKAAGYALNNIIQGFTVLDEGRVPTFWKH